MKITGLKITMRVALFVNVSDSGHDLSEEGSGFGLAQSVAVHDVVKQLATGAVLQNHEDLRFSLNHL